MKKHVQLKYADKALNFRFTTRSIIALEEDVEMSIWAFIDRDNLKHKDYALLLHYALLHEKKDLTVEDTFDLMDDILEELPIQVLGGLLGRAVGLAYAGKVEREEPKKEEVAQAETEGNDTP